MAVSEQTEPKKCHECGGSGQIEEIYLSEPGVPDIAGDMDCPTCNGTGLAPEPVRCECGACWWDGNTWWWRYNKAVTIPLCDIEGTHAHCPGECGCRLTVRDGQPECGPSRAKLLAALYECVGLCRYVCPGDRADADCTGVQLADDDRCRGLEEHTGHFCWLLQWGLATTYAEAAALWAEMKRAGEVRDGD